MSGLSEDSCVFTRRRGDVLFCRRLIPSLDVDFYADEFTEFDALRRRSNASHRLSLVSKFRADWDYFNLKLDVSTKWELRSGCG